MKATNEHTHTHTHTHTHSLTHTHTFTHSLTHAHTYIHTRARRVPPQWDFFTRPLSVDDPALNVPVSNLGSSAAGEGGLSAGQTDLFNANSRLTLHCRGHENLRTAVAVAGLITDLHYTVAIFTAPELFFCVQTGFRRQSGQNQLKHLDSVIQ